jgi:hypothetical protein
MPSPSWQFFDSSGLLRIPQEQAANKIIIIITTFSCYLRFQLTSLIVALLARLKKG